MVGPAPIWSLPALLIVLAVACSSGSTTIEDGRTSGAQTDASVVTGCATDGSYPCTLADVEPAVLDLESDYAAEVLRRLDEVSREDVLGWIATQDRVVESHADETLFMFRLEGGTPFVIVDVAPSGGAETEAQVPLLEGSSGRISYTIPDTASAGRVPGGVVGEGTDRENGQNRKKALFLEPWVTHGSIFDLPDVDPIGRLRAIPDYSHDPSDLRRATGAQVTPRSFLDWQGYDFIFVSTHGGQWPGGSTLSTGVSQHFDVGTTTFREFCFALAEPYSQLPGVNCGIVRTKVKTPQGEHQVEYVTVSVFHKFFEEHYGRHGGLDKAIIYIGACLSLSNTSLASAIAGDSSAYLGWTAAVDLDREIPAAGVLMQLLARKEGGRTIGAAYDTLCGLPQGHCGNSRFGAALQIFENGEEPRNLRLYDLLTPREPTSLPSIGPGLQDGAELQVIGTPGDGIDDRLEIALDIIGLIDPFDTSTDGLSGAIPNVSFASSTADAGDEYVLVLTRDDEELIGYDDAGHPVWRRIGIAGTGEARYLVATVDLEMDVPKEGIDSTLKFTVHLPEGGISDYEVDVRLVPSEPGAVITIGPRTYEFELLGFFGNICTIDDGRLLIATGVGASDTRFSAHIEPDGHDIEGLASVHFVTVDDPATGKSWMADELEFPPDLALAGIPRGSSQIDAVTIEDRTARGTATFIDAAAVNEAWLNNGPYPAPVQGTFAIRCP